MNILAIDTSSKTSVLGIRKGDKLTERSELKDRTHSRDILVDIVALLKHAELSLEELDLIVYGNGPGSFTGLRIAVGVVQGLGYGLQIPSVGISSLDCMARRALREPGCVFVAIHARQTEVYYGAYEMAAHGLVTPLVTPSVSEVDQLPELPHGHWQAAGNAAFLREEIEAAPGQRFVSWLDQEFPAAEDLIELGVAAHAEGLSKPAIDAQPDYLRETVARKMR